MSRITRKRLLTPLFGLCLAAVPLAGQASAQGPGDRPATETGAGAGTGAGTGMATTTNRETRDEGFNPGWLGLLGLAGLAGLMPKKTQTVTTTHRTGEGPAR